MSEATARLRGDSGRAAVRRPGALPVLGVLSLLAVLAVLVAGAIGSATISLSHEVLIILDALGLPVARPWSEADASILLQLRLPRVLGAFIVGAALGTAGALMQGVFRNPLADPYVLGSSAGAGLGVVLAYALSLRFTALGFGPVPLLAFAGAMGATLLVYALARVGWRTPLTHLLLAGVAVGSLLGATMSFLMLLSAALQSQLRSVLAWLAGGVALSGWQELRVLIPLFCLTLIGAWLLSRPLDALALGEDSAAHLGISVERAKLLAIATASLLTAVAVAIGGLIGFVGLVVPHAVRLVVGPPHRLLVPACALGGGAFLVMMDLAARTVAAPNEIPVGLLTAFVGAPFFLYLLRRRRGYSL